MAHLEKPPQEEAFKIPPQFSHIPSRSSLGEKVRNVTNNAISKRMQITYTGGENLHSLRDGGFLSAIPHTSHIDTVVITQLLRQWAKEDGSKDADEMIAQLAFLAGADYWFPYAEPNIFKKPMLLLRNMVAQSVIRILPMERKIPKGKENRNKIREENDQAIAHYISVGGIAAIYPNGTRIPPNIPVDEQEIKAGLAPVALMNPSKPIVPMYIQDSTHIWPKGEFIASWDRQKNHVHVDIGPPIILSELMDIPDDLTAISHVDRGRLRKIANRIFLEAYIDLESTQHQA